MSKPLNSRAIRISFGIAASILAWISIASYWSTHTLVRSFDAAAQAHQALGKFQHIEVLMESAEAGLSAYVISGDAGLLNAFHYAQLTVPFEIRQIDELLPVSHAKRLTFETLRHL